MTIGQLLENWDGDVQALQALEARLPAITSFVADFIKALPLVEQRTSDAEEKVFVQMVDYGWFFDPAMGADTFFNLANLVHSTNGDELDRKMSEHFREQMTAIETGLVTKNPSRGRILSEAFEAQRTQKYVFSIPIFLAQIDGISKEFLGEEYFRYGRSKDIPAKLIQQLAGDDFLESALRALIPKGQMRANSKERNLRDRPAILNRHAVLHGEDLNYDSELNGLKTISLLNFMSEMYHQKKMTEVKTEDGKVTSTK